MKKLSDNIKVIALSMITLLIFPQFASASNFKGILEFAGNDNTNATNPYIAGVSKTYYWSQIEPQKGVYNWDIIDTDLKAWGEHRKKFVFRVSPSGFTSWDKPYSGHGTPQWVINEGVPTVTEVDGAVFPQYWSPIYLAELKTFLTALGKRYNGHPHISYIQMAIGSGGETLPDTETNNPSRLALWQTIGYTDTLWWQTLQTIVGYYKESFPKTPLALMIDSTFLGETTNLHYANVVAWAYQNGYVLQDNGLRVGRQLASPWPQSKHTEEQLERTSQSGDSLQGDIQAALNQDPWYVLIFRSDLDIPSNQPVIEWAAEQVSKLK